jgi:hypothetical protein
MNIGDNLLILEYFDFVETGETCGINIVFRFVSIAGTHAI